MADVGDGGNEDDGGDAHKGHDGPESPDEAATGVCDSEQGYANTAFDGNGTGGVEELCDEEELGRKLRVSWSSTLEVRVVCRIYLRSILDVCDLKIDCFLS